MTSGQGRAADSSAEHVEPNQSEEEARSLALEARMPPAARPLGARMPLAAALPPASDRQSDWYVAGCFVLLIVGLYLTIGPALLLSQWHITKDLNPAFLEALSWGEGRMTLPYRPPDTALYDGKVYSIHPPLFVLLSLAATKLGPLMGVPAEEFYTPWYVMAVALPLPLLGFWMFQQVLRRAEWSAALTAYCLIGTPLLPQLILCRGGSINPVNHMLGVIGLMLIAGDLLGRRRMWPTAVGLIVAIWSRPHLVFFGLAAIAVAWMTKEESQGGILWDAGKDSRGGGCGKGFSRQRFSRRRNLSVIAAALVVSVGTLMTINWLKYDNPFESGYRYIYDYRPNSFLGSRALTYGLFSPHFIPENAYSMNISPPDFRLTSQGLIPQNSAYGVSIWLTSPLLLGGFLGVRRWWKDKAARALMLSSLIVIGTFLMYHSRGSSSVGYFAYSLDFLPVWLAAIAPWAIEKWRRAFTLGCLAYSGLYFHLLWQAYP